MESYPVEEITLGGPVYRFILDGKPLSGEWIMTSPPEPKPENYHAAITSSFGSNMAVITFEFVSLMRPWNTKESQLTYNGMERWGDNPPKIVITEDFEDA